MKKFFLSIIRSSFDDVKLIKDGLKSPFKSVRTNALILLLMICICYIQAAFFIILTIQFFK